jgi:hypothetical protein
LEEDLKRFLRVGSKNAFLDIATFVNEAACQNLDKRK